MVLHQRQKTTEVTMTLLTLSILRKTEGTSTDCWGWVKLTLTTVACEFASNGRRRCRETPACALRGEGKNKLTKEL